MPARPLIELSGKPGRLRRRLDDHRLGRHRPRPGHRRFQPAAPASTSRGPARPATGSMATSWGPIRPARRPSPTSGGVEIDAGIQQKPDRHQRRRRRMIEAERNLISGQSDRDLVSMGSMRRRQCRRHDRQHRRGQFHRDRCDGNSPLGYWRLGIYSRNAAIVELDWREPASAARSMPTKGM